MKTRSAPDEPLNIAAGVKARRNAGVSSPLFGPLEAHSIVNSSTLDQCATSTAQITISSQNLISSEKSEQNEATTKSRQSIGQKMLKDSWTADDRRLFFQGIRLFGRNFNELTRFIRSRGHRVAVGSETVNKSTCKVSKSIDLTPSFTGIPAPLVTGNLPHASGSSITTPVPIGITATTLGPPPLIFPQMAAISTQDLNMPSGGRTRDQVRLFYQQTWHKLRRYIKYPDNVPQHVREVYAIINWSIMRARIKKALDNRLGEKLNELVHYGSTCVKYNGRRFLLRTPVCPALKYINNISAPTQEFSLPDDVWVELVPSTQSVAWRVLEAEQNPRLRLHVDINRQLSDVISLVECKWVYPVERIRSLLLLADPQPSESHSEPAENVKEYLLLRLPKEQKIDGAISLQEVSRTRSADISLTAYLARRATTERVCETSMPAAPDGDHDTTSLSNSRRDGPLSSACNDGLIDQLPLSIDIRNASPPNCNTSNQATNFFATEHDQQFTESRAKQSDVAPGPSATQTSMKSYNIPSNSNSTVSLDLRAIGKSLANGVTYEEARAIKVLVIHLALGCPDRIRFEYDFVWLSTGGSKPTDLSCRPPSQLRPTNDSGISNGLRRLLHLNASDYLSFKDWTTSADVVSDRRKSNSRKHSKGERANIVAALPKPVASLAPIQPHPVTVSSESSPIVIQPKPSKPPTSDHARPPVARLSPVSLAKHPIPIRPLVIGHEAVVVGQQPAKVVVARQLNVNGPVSTVKINETPSENVRSSNKIATSATLPTFYSSHVHPTTPSKYSMTSPNSIVNEIPSPLITIYPKPEHRVHKSEPVSSLNALQAFNRTQVLSSRKGNSRVRQPQRRNMQIGGHILPNSTPHSSSDSNKFVASNFQYTPSTIASASSLASPHVTASSNAHRTSFEMNPTLTDCSSNSFPSILYLENTDQLSRQHQQQQFSTDQLHAAAELNFPFSLDGYSCQSSTSDTMKSLFNAIMCAVPSATSDGIPFQFHASTDSNITALPMDTLYTPTSEELLHSNAATSFPESSSDADFNRPMNSCNLYSNQSTDFVLAGDDSSLGEIIKGASQRNESEFFGTTSDATLSDSLASKIILEMADRNECSQFSMMYTDQSAMDLKPGTTDGPILFNLSKTESNSNDQSMQDTITSKLSYSNLERNYTYN